VVPTPKLEGVAGAQNASNWGGSSWYVFDKAPNRSGAVDFLKSVWASKDPAALGFYNTILKGAGAMGTFLPSRTGSNYTAKDEFFYKSQAAFGDFAKWMANVPSLRYTANYNAWGSAIGASLNKMYKGSLKSPDEVLADATTLYNQSISQ
jgi:lactose/L-arabinose transport system substrate-binding protein